MFDLTTSKKYFYRLLFGLLLFNGSMVLSAQNWAPIGARWHYGQTNLGPPGTTFRLFESVGDTIIDGRVCSVVEGRCNCTNEMPNANFLYEEEGRVFLYSSVTETFNLLYDFTLAPGESWVVHFDTGDSTSFTVDSVSYLVSGEDSLRVLHLDPLQGNYRIGDAVIEKIGGTSCMYPMISFCDPLTGGIRCYEDEALGLIQFNESVGCTFTPVEEARAESIDVFPIPTTGKVNIRSSFQIRRLIVYDLTGKIQYEAQVNTDFAEISIEALSAGCYFLRVEGEGAMMYHEMIVKG